MTTTRREPAKKRRDENGNIVCSCGCGRPPGKGRRAWHSQECVDKWMVANSSQYVRGKLYERDKGVCAMCGVDADRAMRRAEITRVWHWSRAHDRVRCWHDRHHWTVTVPRWIVETRQWHDPRIQASIQKRLDRMKSEGWDVHRRSSWWEADHIVPVVEGGGQCSIENYRTLCIRCHRKVTRELRARLAKKRKELP